jgi:antitoxin YefM
MNSKHTLPISEARKRIFEIAEEVQKPDTYYTLTEKGRPKAVIISAEEFESWIETLEVSAQFPNLDRDIAEARKDLKNHDFIALEDILAKNGFVLADKENKKYGTSRSALKKSAKRLK